jgi:hypothetical protein
MVGILASLALSQRPALPLFAETEFASYSVAADSQNLPSDIAEPLVSLGAFARAMDPVPQDFDAQFIIWFCPDENTVDLFWNNGSTNDNKVLERSETGEPNDWTQIATPGVFSEYFQDTTVPEEWGEAVYRIRFQSVDPGPEENWALDYEFTWC